MGCSLKDGKININPLQSRLAKVKRLCSGNDQFLEQAITDHIIQTFINSKMQEMTPQYIIQISF